MTEAELIKDIASRSGFRQNQVKLTLEHLFSVTADALNRDDTITLPGIGKISARDIPAGMVTNPQTGIPQPSEARRVAKVSISKTLKKAINKAA